jgi:hypothetical protein
MRTTGQDPEPGPKPDPFLRTNVRSAAWNAVVAVAIIFIMFVTFYGISTERQQQTASAPAATTTPTQPPSTTGQGGAQDNGQKQPDQSAQKPDEPKAQSPATGEDQPKEQK